MLFFARRYNLFHDIVIGYFIVIFIRVWLIRFLKTYGIYKKKLEAASSPAAADESRQQTSKKKLRSELRTKMLVLNLFYARTEHSLRLIYVILTRRLSSFQKIDPFKNKKKSSYRSAAAAACKKKSADSSNKKKKFLKNIRMFESPFVSIKIKSKSS